MDFERFYKLRRRLFDLIRAVDEGYHKSYEGAMDLTFSFTNVFTSLDSSEPPESVTVELHYYLLIDEGRHKRFTGATLDECLDKLENWIARKDEQLVNETGGLF